MNKFEIVDDPIIKEVETKLPVRSTKKSAGYDFFSKITVSIPPGQTYTFITDVKIKLDDDCFLMMATRSGNGCKGIGLRNQVGIIDADYYGNIDNDGNISVCLHNTGRGIFRVAVGDKIAQGIILKYGVSEHKNECQNKKRKGGHGSTGK